MDRQRRRVLVVDDSEICLGLAREALEGGGYEVATLQSGIMLAARVREWAPHLVLMDVNMPGIKGPDLIRILRKQREVCPVLLHSDRPDEELELLANECGAAGYVRKGDNYALMLRHVRRVVFGEQLQAVQR